MSNTIRAVLGIGALVVVVVLFVVLQDSGSDDEPATTTSSTTVAGGQDETSPPEKPEKPEKPKPEKPEVPTIQLEGGQPVGGVAELEFDQGDEIVFKVSSDVTDHIHLHGYDVMKDVTAGDTVTMRVPATISGVFEAELEESVVPIAEITVNPG
jgi:hypothetical protein